MAYDRSKVRVLKKTSGSKHQALIKEQVIKTSLEEVKKKRQKNRLMEDILSIL